ncbi:MAG TPA: ferrochelatase [Gammaproteobacteria bacterium]|jgi:ferrochelatase|nr:ferrochelatase [Gammaproteobacteria bacterium]
MSAHAKDLAETDASHLGVLLVNLGTPDAPTPQALRRYLAEFLSDPDVITLPRLLWWPILYGLVLPFRPARSAEAYQRIWTAQGSPLLHETRAIAVALEAELESQLKIPVTVTTGMRYGQPSLAHAAHELMHTLPTTVVVLPLYPQFAQATTGSTLKQLNTLESATSALAVGHAVRDYHDHPSYIAALATSVRDHWQQNGRGQKLLISFHGIPQQVAERGDPYPKHCQRTAQLLATALELKDDEWQLVFQSRFGPAPWLQPYTDITLKQLAADGKRNVDVICPGFATDCLETLEEIALRYAEVFRAAGGEALRYIPALNSRPDHIKALAQIVRARLGRPESEMPVITAS